MERLELSPELARDILHQAKAKGASQGDLLMVESDSFFVTVRLGEIEKISQAQEKRLGLRLFFGASSATASTSDISKGSIERLVDETGAMARSTAQDEYSGLPAPEECARTFLDLDLLDDSGRSLSVEERSRLALETEKTALDYDRRITNSEGAEFSNQAGRVIYANSHGFSGEYRGSTYGLSVVPVAALDGMMQRDYWYSSQRKFSRLESPESVGRKAAARVLRRLGARKIKTREVPVVFEPEIAATLLRHLSGALSGYSLYKGASFLIGKLGDKIASELITVVDDGTIPAALGSKPFDGEGLSTGRRTVVEKGVLQSYLLDTYSGRKLGYPSTGNAARSVGEPPGVAPTNFYLSPGSFSPEEDNRLGGRRLLCHRAYRFWRQPGDRRLFARGGRYLDEKGELTYPVEEVTIAGNLKEILLNIEMVGNDLEMRDRICAPTVKISRMTVAGD